MAPALFNATSDGAIQFAVRVAPRAARERIEGVARDAQGMRMLKVAVNAPAEGGKANKAVLALLAAAIGVAKTRLSVVSGASARRKVVRLDAVDAALLMRLNEWLAGLSDLA